jgi:hypothetical protein
MPNRKREIKIVDLTGKTALQLETAFNNNYGPLGWKIIQIVALGSKNYLIAEREL